MTARPRSVRRTAVPVLAAASLLLVPSAALADPPAADRDPCSDLLAQAATFPGGMQTASGTVRLVSDGYVSHLSAQPPCSAPGT